MAGRKRKQATYESRRGPVKYLRYEAEFTDIYGAPLTIIDPDQRKQKKARDEARAEAWEEAKQEAIAEGKGPKGVKEPTKFPFQPVTIDEATFGDLVVMFADDIPYGDQPKQGEPALRATHLEREHATQVCRTFSEPVAVNGSKDSPLYVGIGEEDLKWLVEELQENGDRKFKGTIPSLLLERLGADWELDKRAQADLEDAAKGKGLASELEPEPKSEKEDGITANA